jgi:hypothetical protein
MTNLSSEDPLPDFGERITGSGPHGFPTVEEFAAAANKSKRTIRGMMARGQIRFTRIGRTPYPHPSALRELMESNERAPQCAARSRPRRRA